MIRYLIDESLEAIFVFVGERYAKLEEVPAYRNEPGFDKLCGVLERSCSDVYYPSLLDKAGYLLIGINKGHFFSNGNKRLALVVMTTFLRLNDLRLKRSDKSWYRAMLWGLFPEYTHWEDFEEFTSTDFATYHLSIMIAESGVYGISHDELKRRVLVFLEKATEPT